MEDRTGKQFCASCGVTLCEGEDKYCDVCKYNLGMEDADTFEGRYEQMELPADSYKYVGRKE